MIEKLLTMALNMGVLGWLAFMAFGTGWHAALFATIGYLITGISNKITDNFDALDQKNKSPLR